MKTQMYQVQKLLVPARVTVLSSFVFFLDIFVLALMLQNKKMR